MSVNPYLVKSTFVSALGGLLFGFDTAVIAGTTHQLTEVYQPYSLFIGIDRFQCPMGHGCRSDDGGIPRPADRAARQPAHHGGVLFPLGVGLRVCLELGIVARLPHHRRLGHWRIVGARADVYRGAVPCEVARPPGWFLPGQYCSRHPARILVEFLDWPDELWSRGMALAIRDRCTACTFIPANAVFHSPQSAVAGYEEQNRAKRSTFCA